VAPAAVVPAHAPLAQLSEYVCSCIAETGRAGTREGETIRGLSLDETGLDSLELMEMIMAIEDRFGITIDDAALLGTHSIDALCDLITSQAKAAKG
jgi:acyl carrier protein